MVQVSDTRLLRSHTLTQRRVERCWLSSSVCAQVQESEKQKKTPSNIWVYSKKLSSSVCIRRWHTEKKRLSFKYVYIFPNTTWRWWWSTWEKDELTCHGSLACIAANQSISLAVVKSFILSLSRWRQSMMFRPDSCRHNSSKDCQLMLILILMENPLSSRHVRTFCCCWAFVFIVFRATHAPIWVFYDVDKRINLILASQFWWQIFFYMLSEISIHTPPDICYGWCR